MTENWAVIVRPQKHPNAASCWYLTDGADIWILGAKSARRYDQTPCVPYSYEEAERVAYRTRMTLKIWPWEEVAIVPSDEVDKRLVEDTISKD